MGNLSRPLVLFALLVVAPPAAAQSRAARTASSAAATPATPPPEAPDAPAAVDSPRASMTRFFDLSREQNFEQAAAYLQLDEAQRARGPELVRRLNAVLDRYLVIDRDKLSPESWGRRDDGLAPQLEQLGTIPRPGGSREGVHLVRVDMPDHARWLFTAATVGRIDAWYDALDDRWLREHLPEPLLRHGPRDLLWWQWLVLPLLFLAAWLVGSVLSWLARHLLAALARRTTTPWDDTIVRELRSPFTLAWALLVFSLVIRFLGFTARGTTFIHDALAAGVLVVLFWIALRMLVVAAEVATRAPWAGPAVVGALPLVVRVGKVAVFAIGGITVLSELGYPVASLIAGLGIGGLALALAAQKTVENVFGSISIGVDQPFRVGDFVKIEDLLGTVEQLGLRSTRIRTPERTLVTIPNGKLAEMRIETFAARDRIRLFWIAGVVYGTTAAQVREIVEGFETTLRAHPRVHKEGLMVRLKAFGAYSIDIEVQAYFDTRDWSEFINIRQDVLLQLMEVVERAKTSLAFPTQTVQLEKAERIERASA